MAPGARGARRIAARRPDAAAGGRAPGAGGGDGDQKKKAEALETEAVHQRKFDRVLAQEEVWVRKGIEARRTRNEGRVRRLEALRIERAARRDRVGKVGLELAEGERSGRLVAAASSEIERVEVLLARIA